MSLSKQDSSKLSSADLDKAYLDLIKDQQINNVNYDVSFPILLKKAAKALQVCRASIWLMRDNLQEMQCIALYDLNTDENKKISAVITECEFPSYLKALVSSRVIDASDAFVDPRTCELTDSYLKPLNVQSLLDATLRHNEQLRGVFCCEMVGVQRDWTKEQIAFSTSIADLITQKLILSELKVSQANHVALFERSSEGILVFDNSAQTFVDANSSVCRIFQLEKEAFIGESPANFSPKYQPDGQLSKTKAIQYIKACLEEGTQTFEWMHLRGDGTPFNVEATLNSVQQSGVKTVFASIRDISEKKESERLLQYRASHDSLTGLLNRESFNFHVDALIEESIKRSDTLKIALLILDLNQFKEINDTLGHAAGDEALKKIANILKQNVDNIGGKLFRFGGDEFVAVFDSDVCTKSFEELPDIIHESLRKSITLGAVKIEMSASIGASLYPENGKNSGELLRCADVAMYHFKRQNDDSPWYDVKNDLNNRRRLSMMGELGAAIRKDELLLHFQPRVEIPSGKVTGCEVLLRWQHPEHGLIYPGEFVPMIEMTEHINPLTDWVIKDTIKQIKHLQEKGFDLPLAINVSGRNITDAYFSEVIKELLFTNDMSPHLFEIEITESALINQPQKALKNLEKISELGVSIALDDYGTGYSSLSYLTELPLNTLKIDRSFVFGMLENKTNSTIVKSTIDLAKNLSLKVVAEGVEDKATYDAIKAMQCDELQGYFIAKPMPMEALEDWLQNKRWKINRLFEMNFLDSIMLS